MVNLLMITVLLLGFKTVIGIKKEGFPSISKNIISIQTFYPGASARDVEINVTMTIEEELEKVANLKEVLSTSSEGMSIITIVADDDVDDAQFKQIYDDVGEKLASISNLPSGVDGKPSYRQWTSDEMPVLEIAISGDYKKLRKFIPYLYTEIKRISGVSEVVKVGFPDEEYQIVVDMEKAKKNYLDLQSIANTLKARNIEGSGGTLESYIGEKKIVAYNKYKSLDEVLDTNLRRTYTGSGVRLKDIAEIKRVPENLNLTVRNSGKRGVSLMVKKKGNSDLLNTLDKIHSFLNNVSVPVGIKVITLNDQSKFTRNRLKLLTSNALMGIALVVVLLTLILGRRTAFWTAFSIPFSILGMFIFLPGMDLTLNAMTLGGMVLVLGILVDDAIILSESVDRAKEEGHSGADAVVLAVKQVWKPILGASLTTMVAFWPLSQLGGLPGKFIWIIPVIVALSLVASLIDTFFVLPVHLMHGKTVEKKEKRFVKKLEKMHKNSLDFLKNYRYVVLFTFIMLLASAGFIAKNYVKTDPFPQDSAEGFTIQLTLPAGTSLELAQDQIKVIEKEISALPPAELDGFSVRIGTHAQDTTIERGTDPHLAIIFIYLKTYIERTRTAQEISSSLREKILPFLKDKKIEALFELTRVGPPLGRAFEIRVASEEDRPRTAKVEEIKSYLRTVKGVLEIEDDNIPGKIELDLKLNFDKLAEMGGTVAGALSTIRIAFDGQVVTDIIEHNVPIDFRLRLNRKGRSDRDFVNSLSLINKKGYLINFDHFSTFEEKDSQSEIFHVNNRRTTTIFGQLDKDIISPGKLMDLVKENFPSSYQVPISYSGEPVENEKIFGNMKLAFITAIIGIFLVIAIILNSISKPFIVLSAIPFAVVGIIYTVFAFSMPLSIFIMMGVVGLSGIVVNDSLVMVHTIDRIIGEKGFSTNAVIEGAVRRLRPVLLTTFTTVMGLLPTGYAIGGYDPFIAPMCLAMAYGLLFATLITLILIPMLYLILIDIKNFGASKLS